MDPETLTASGQIAGDATENGGRKRDREEGIQSDKVVDDGGSKKPKVENSTEEKSTNKELEENKGVDGKKDVDGPVSVGPNRFGSSVEMFDYFYKILHYWTPNINVNTYEHKALVELLRKGHMEPHKKISKGIHAFQVRYHPRWKNRCFFLIRDDKSIDDFSFRKCVDHILPLPENMKLKSNVNKSSGGGCGGGKFGSGGGGRGRGSGSGRGEKSRN